MPDIQTTLFHELEHHGLKAAITSVTHLAELKEEILGLKEQSLLREEFYNDNLSWFKFDYADVMPDVQSIIVIAYPQMITRLNFEHHEGKHTVILPPTYVYTTAFERVKQIIKQVLEPHNYRFERAVLPGKLLAVRTGLGVYGRNNICYVKGMGSFHRLFFFYTNFTPIEDHWGGKTVMPECENCTACIKACPTQAIRDDRFLIDAEKCITHFNEHEGEFPDWFDKKWHNAIIGCMKCQSACPQNRAFVSLTEDEVTFSPEETQMILQKTPLAQLPSVKQKLDSIDMTDNYELLGRNLSVLIG